MKLRGYQQEAVDSIFNFFETHPAGNPVIAMPTGTGKSLVIAGACERIIRQWPTQKILILTHVKELIEQNHDKLVRMWPQCPAGIYSAGLNRRDVHKRVIFGGVMSVVNKPEIFGHVDLIFVDEAHRVSPDEEGSYLKFINALKTVNPYLKVIGLTATPWRLAHGKIIEEHLFTDFCFNITDMASFNRLIDEGYLSPLVPSRTEFTLDVDGVQMRGSEFVEKQLQIAVNKEEITRAALAEVMEKCEGRKSWLVFAAGIDHALSVAEILNDVFQVPAACIHSRMSARERDENIRRHQNGEIVALVNNNILTTGYDHPSIDLIVMLRPTGSTILWVQMLGRGTRVVYEEGYDLETIEGRLNAIAAGPKQDCLVLDFAANSNRLGPINDPVIPRKKGEKTGTAPVKVCDHCDTINHASVRYCTQCGAEFIFQTKIKQFASTAELIKTELPQIEIFQVSHVTYNIHKKKDKPDMVKVSYFCSFRKFDEYICPEHSGYAQRKSSRWWAARSSKEAPLTTKKMLENVHDIALPTHLKIWINKRFPEIMDYCFDGSEFGEKPVSDAQGVTCEVKGKVVNNSNTETNDIPF